LYFAVNYKLSTEELFRRRNEAAKVKTCWMLESHQAGLGLELSLIEMTQPQLCLRPQLRFPHSRNPGFWWIRKPFWGYQ